MIWFIIYWIICGLITFNLTNTTIYVSVFKSDFIIPMLFGGIVIPILFIAGILDWVRIILFE